MPFLAHRTGAPDDRVVPEEVADSVTVICPACDGRMRPRGDASQQARQFMHVANLDGSAGTDCTGADHRIGTSERHRIYKSAAVSGLRNRFETEAIERCGPEVAVLAEYDHLNFQDRRADAFVEFCDENAFFGKGIVVEVQYRNTAKDITAVTAAYLQAGYSVYWAFEEDFSKTQFRLARFNRAFSERWPAAFAPYFADPEDVRETVDSVEVDSRIEQGGW